MLKVAQVGLHGFGRVHLGRIDRLVDQGRVELVAGADPAGPEAGRDLRCYDSLTELLAHHEVDIVSIATPIGTHMALAMEALAAGAHVMLEKPPVAGLEQFWRLEQARQQAGRSIQVGFQSLGGGGIARMRQLAAQRLGQVVSVQVWGMWCRDLAYFKRARWAGQRVMNGQRVADGVCTNALAHSIATACRIVSLLDVKDLVSIETELYHAFDTQSDDTSWLRVNHRLGAPIDVSLTLCGPRPEHPSVTLVGTEGEARLQYTEDVVTWQSGGQRQVEHLGRTDLLENLVDHIERGVDLLVPLAQTLGFMAVLEATQTAPDPTPIADQYLTWEGAGDEAHPIPQDIEVWQHRCLESGLGYAAAGAPWASDQTRHTWTPSP
ncbi:MAG: Gfo/Idh/MocA family oxidoreductase [Propionibacteriaceae bacterium]|jgi:predicted dehydrogenase|nr:Gfo/Idh/MocA family oxidoreductase [Propionibacteriaceae bacterium]